MRDVVKVGASSAALPVTSLLSGPLLAHALGPDGRGQLAAIVAPLTLVPLLFGLGFPSAASRLVAAGEVRGRAAFKALVPLGTLMGALACVTMVATAPLFLHKYPPGVGPERLLALLLIPSISLDIVRGVRYGQGRYGVTSRERMIFAFLRLVVLIVLYFTHALTVIVAAVVIQVTSLIGQLTLLLQREEPSSPPALVATARRAAVSYGIRASGGQLSVLILLRLDQALMLPLSGPRELGYYAVAVSIGEVPQMLMAQIRSLLLSEFSARQDIQWIAKACRACILLGTVFAVVVGIVTPFALPPVFGHAFTGAITPTIILLVAGIPAGLAAVLSAALSSFNRPLTQTLSQLPGVALTLIGLPLLVPRYGANGAAVVSLVSYLTCSIVLLYQTRKHLQLEWRAVLRPALSEVIALFRGLRRG
jgi:O-antigen/teichoic acid export membrane protein